MDFSRLIGENTWWRFPLVLAAVALVLVLSFWAVTAIESRHGIRQDRLDLERIRHGRETHPAPAGGEDATGAIELGNLQGGSTG
ncbi:hypothetical protein DTO063F5_8715 [Paecilomyces variotii]|nr:hypothetical protein DTO063F5_8715 [Paecilomyces variotii]